eukprot:gnl/MRDRNA2_/MRDRNA2_73853_c0_seq1.p1 gnl/MRDRNA2_/MRDRNA2_73853_c0~~gnl/MRDRNA2_/MRDRNA2_73853_c0_seq1.p1  ORF type:complete len:654 (-),score=83.53 gnl/MRDRNA2_/MRDRNA2_73853_c0_seq1:455-2206(-)
MVKALGIDLPTATEMGKEESVIRSVARGSGAILKTILVVAGQDPHGTNTGIASFLQLIRLGKAGPYVDGPLDLRNTPSFGKRGIHLNGWPLKYPYGFRAWQEEDWKRFVDIAWAQRINLFYLWPFMEIIPLPISKEDEAYLQEVSRVVDYAQHKRGMEVWIMQSTNRIGVSDCGSPDPRFRMYWVMGTCQKDMNPGDEQDYQTLLQHFEVFYRNVNNADGYCMIDADPGGWPGSPLSDQTHVFNGARKLLDQYSIKGNMTKLIDWMWFGWGRPMNAADMQETIRNFKQHLVEPWQLISGQAKYLDSAKGESVLNKTIFLEYNAIESEPSFPATNLGFDGLNGVFQTAAKYPELEGIMGNNMLALLQLPRTFYFFKAAWDTTYTQQTEYQALLDLGEQLYPEQKELISTAFLNLREENPQKLSVALKNISKLIADSPRPGPIGRLLFPDSLSVPKNLQMQLETRLARQSLVQGIQQNSSLEASTGLVESYFDKLLAWNNATGWNKMIDITIWRVPIWTGGADLTGAMGRLKTVIAQGKPYASYAQIDDFFSGIATRLVSKYDRDSVMIGCVDEFKLDVIQSRFR